MIAACLLILGCCQAPGPGDPVAALAVRQAAVDRAPTDPKARYLLAELLARQFLDESAVAEYRKALELGMPQPQAVLARASIAFLLEEHGRDREALAECRAVLALMPPDHEWRPAVVGVQQRIAARHAGLAEVGASETRATVIIVLIPLLLLAGWAGGRRIAARSSG